MSNDNKTGRNSLDVIMELVNIHLSRIPAEGHLTKEELEEIYLYYYHLVKNN